MSLLEGNTNTYLRSETNLCGFGMSGPTTSSNIAFWTGPGYSLGHEVGPGVWPCFTPANSNSPDLFELAEHTRFERQLHYDWNRPGDAPRPNAGSGTEPPKGPGVTYASPSINRPDSFNDNVFKFGSDVARQTLGIVSTSNRRTFMQNSTIELDEGHFANRQSSQLGEHRRFHENRNGPTHDLYGISFGIIVSPRKVWLSQP